MNWEYHELQRHKIVPLITWLGYVLIGISWGGYPSIGLGQTLGVEQASTPSSLNQMLTEAQAILASTPDSSLLLAKQAENMAIKEALPSFEGLALLIQGQAQFNLTQVDSALNLFQRSADLLLADSIEVQHLYKVLQSLAWGMLNSSRQAKAEPYFDLLLELSQSPFLFTYRARAIADYGACLISQGKLAQGVRYLEENQPLIEEARDSLNLIRNHLNLALAYRRLGAYQETLGQYQAALDLQSASGELEDMMLTYNRRGRLYQELGQFGQALSEYQQSRMLADSLGQSLVAADALSNLGTLYANHGDYDEAWEYYQKAHILYAESHDSVRLSVYFIRLGNWHFLQGGLDSALHWYQRSLDLETQLLRANGIATALTNLGSVYARKKQFEKALDSYKKALDLRRANENRFELPSLLINMANLAYDLARYAKAENYAQEGLRLAEQQNQLGSIADAAEVLRKIYEAQRRPLLALKMYRRFVETRDSLDHAANREKLNRFAFEKEALADSLEFLRKSEVKDLALARQAAIVGRQRAVIVAIILGFLASVAIAWLIYRGKRRSDELLLNILPAETAAELKATGRTSVREYERVSILFSDFVGFTQLAEKLPASELVAEIDTCFKAFDEIMTQYGLEKIKTIGDAYMAAGGLPDPLGASTKTVVLAGLAMQQFIEQRKFERGSLGLPYFEMRVGIHTGPVVAGVVGLKKFQYDVWGDTVNTASRIESHGAIGRVNISASTYELLLGNRELDFQARGAIEVKGKGMVEMYFIRSVESSS